jgi:hypothetical protein
MMYHHQEVNFAPSKPDPTLDQSQDAFSAVTPRSEAFDKPLASYPRQSPTALALMVCEHWPPYPYMNLQIPQIPAV